MTPWAGPVVVDTLRVGAYCDMLPVMARVHEARRRCVGKTAAAGLDDAPCVDGSICAVGPGAWPYRVTYRCAEWDAMVATGVEDATEASTPSVMVTFRARYLATTPLEEVALKLERVVLELTGAESVLRWVLSRVDLARDVLTDEVRSTFVQRLQLVTRAVRREETCVDPELEQQVRAAGLDGYGPAISWHQELRRYCAGTRFSGYSIGARGAASVHLRWYDKAFQARAKALEWWEQWVCSMGCPAAAAWESLGLHSRASVWRCEFELGRGPLKEFLLPTGPAFAPPRTTSGNPFRSDFAAPAPPCELRQLLSSTWRERVWAYLTQSWCRVVEDDARGPGVDELHEMGGRRRVEGVTRPEDRRSLAVWRVVQQGGHVDGPLPSPAARRKVQTRRVPVDRLRKQAGGLIAAVLARSGAAGDELVGELDALVADASSAFVRQQTSRLSEVSRMDASTELRDAFRAGRARGGGEASWAQPEGVARGARALVGYLNRSVGADNPRSAWTADDVAARAADGMRLLRGAGAASDDAGAAGADVSGPGLSEGVEDLSSARFEGPSTADGLSAADKLGAAHRASVELLSAAETQVEARRRWMAEHADRGDVPTGPSRMHRIAARARRIARRWADNANALDEAAEILLHNGVHFGGEHARRVAGESWKIHHRAQERARLWSWATQYAQKETPDEAVPF